MSGCWCVWGGGGARGEAPKWWSSISRSVVNTWLLAQGCKACSNGFGIDGLKSALRESASRGAWDLSLEARERRTQSTRWVDKHGHCASVRRLSFIKQSASRHVLQVELTWYLLAIPLTAVEEPLLAYSLSSPIEIIEYHSELILLMLFRDYCDMQLNKNRLYIERYHRYYSQI